MASEPCTAETWQSNQEIVARSDGYLNPRDCPIAERIRKLRDREGTRIALPVFFAINDDPADIPISKFKLSSMDSPTSNRTNQTCDWRLTFRIAAMKGGMAPGI